MFTSLTHNIDPSQFRSQITQLEQLATGINGRVKNSVDGDFQLQTGIENLLPQEPSEVHFLEGGKEHADTFIAQGNDPNVTSLIQSTGEVYKIESTATTGQFTVTTATGNSDTFDERELEAKFNIGFTSDGKFDVDSPNPQAPTETPPAESLASLPSLVTTDGSKQGKVATEAFPGAPQPANGETTLYAA